MLPTLWNRSKIGGIDLVAWRRDVMIRGDQLAEALRLTGLSPKEIAQQTSVPLLALIEGLHLRQALKLTHGQEKKVRRAIRQHGVAISTGLTIGVGVEAINQVDEAAIASGRKARLSWKN